MAKLTITERDRSTVYEIFDDVVVVGKGAEAMVRLGDEKASDRHCEIKAHADGSYVLIDLETKNGTKVNGSFVNQCRLRNGDTIQIGDVRIAYAGEEAPAAAPPAAVPARPVAAARPLAAVPPRRPAVDPRRPSVPAAAAARPARPTPPPEDRGPLPRRYRTTVPAPLILLGVVVGLLLFLVAALYFGNPAAGKNEEIWSKMKELMAQRRYKDAMDLADKADPMGDSDWYDRVQLARMDAKSQFQGMQGLDRGFKVKEELDDIEIFIQENRNDIEGIAARWTAFIRKYRKTFPHWAEQARIRFGETVGRPFDPSSRPPREAPKPTGTSRIDREYEKATAQAQTLEGQDRFQDAIDTLFDFFEENQGRTGDLETWRERVEGLAEGIQDRAEERWQELDERAQIHVKAGRISQAVDVYKKVAENFGMEKYVRQATEKKKELLLR